MPLYETVFIARQDLTPGQNEELTNQMSKIVQDNDGKILNTEFWGLRTLAYRIKKNRKGHYVMLQVDAPAAAKDELERNLRLHEDVLRYMTLKMEQVSEGPSAMMRKESSDNAPREHSPRREGEAA